MQENQMVKRLFILTNKLKRFLDKKHRKNGVHVGQARILTHLYRRREEITYQKDIESAFQIRGGTVTGIIDSLARNGHIKRIESELDKRRKKIVLTKKGEEMALKGIETTSKMETNINSLLKNNERLIFNEVILKINKWIDEEENE